MFSAMIKDKITIKATNIVLHLTPATAPDKIAVKTEYTGPDERVYRYRAISSVEATGGLIELSGHNLDVSLSMDSTGVSIAIKTPAGTHTFKEPIGGSVRAHLLSVLSEYLDGRNRNVSMLLNAL